LRVSEKGNRKWELRYTSPLTGKRVDMGLGNATKGHVGLAAARELAAAARERVAKGLDPVGERERGKAERAAAARAAKAPATFGAFAEGWLNDNLDQFRNDKHRAQWGSTLRTYGAGIWKKPLAGIVTQDVLEAIKPIWKGKPETAKRTQGRIERILDAAKAAGLRTGDNPARWRGHLDKLLPKRGKPNHHPALPYDNAPNVVALVRQRSGVAARALEFLILTAARSGEVRGMTWAELDTDRTTWAVPAERMKAGREHRVPLTTRARDILAEMDRLRPEDKPKSGLVFPGEREGRPLSDMTLTAVLRRLREDQDIAKLLRDATGNDVVVHGFRSTFRDWAEDVARFPARVVEGALAHSIRDKAEAAYRRGDAYDMRSELMQVWADYLSGSGTAPSD
jgi:integrase